VRDTGTGIEMLQVPPACGSGLPTSTEHTRPSRKSILSVRLVERVCYAAGHSRTELVRCDRLAVQLHLRTGSAIEMAVSLSHGTPNATTRHSCGSRLRIQLRTSGPSCAVPSVAVELRLVH
jgi:hypothetical protein